MLSCHGLLGWKHVHAVLRATQLGVCTRKIEGVWEIFEGVWNIFENSGKSGNIVGEKNNS
jgi:hypothetical protein